MAWDRATTLTSPTGAGLNVFSRLPEGTPRALVQINHGLAEHAGRYARFADFLASQGFAAYAQDHRGHGGTRATDAPRGTFAGKDGAQKVIGDVLALHDHIGREHPGVPVVLFGHSMGGLIALNFLMRHGDRIAAAAIWNANFSAGLPGRLAQAILRYERFRLGSDVPSRILPRLTFQAWGASIPNARTPFDWLSHDEAEVAKYIADPACGWDASVGLWRDVFSLIFSGATFDQLRNIPRGMPIHLAGGSEDPATNNGRAVAQLADRLKSAGLSDVTTKIYAGTRHETLNGLCREEAMADFAAWLEPCLARSRI